jgi:DNA primase
MDGIFQSDFVDEVRNSFDLVDLVSEYVHLKKTGGSYLGLCPLHAEKTPSFTVSREKQLFYCFGCGEGGNIYTFVMKMEGLTFPEAVRQLAERAGIRLPDTEYSPAAEKKLREKQKLLSALEWAVQYYQWKLKETPEGRAAQSYLNKRGISAKAIEKFGLGYAPDSWNCLKDFLQKKGLNLKELMAAGLLIENEKKQTYDRFRNRIIFQICNQRGETIAFGGRILGDGLPKYLNSPETQLFEKGKNLYALHLARESIRRGKQAVIMEGYMDVITAHQAGITNTVASLGTSLTEAQARLLHSQAEEVVIVYDADSAGQAATWRGMQVLRQAGCLVKVGRLPHGLDPDDFIRKHGGEAFRRDILDSALLLGEYQLASLADQFDLKKADERIRFNEKMVDVLLSTPNAIEREEYMEKAAALLHVPTASVREELRKKMKSTGLYRPSAGRGPGAKADSIPDSFQDMEDRVFIQLFCLWSQNPSLMDRYRNDLDEDDFPLPLQAVFTKLLLDRQAVSPPVLFDILPEGRYRQLFSKMLIKDEIENSIAQKAIEDCIRRLKCIRIARQRKELEDRLAKLDPVLAKGEVNELSRKWLELRKHEEMLNRPGEGGKGLG